MSKGNPTRTELIDALDRLRQSRVCAHHGSFACDCKAGGGDLGDGSGYDIYSGGEENGCFELRLAGYLLSRLSDEEYERLKVGINDVGGQKKLIPVEMLEGWIKRVRYTYSGEAGTDDDRLIMVGAKGALDCIEALMEREGYKEGP